jgi:hypothetical protein
MADKLFFDVDKAGRKLVHGKEPKRPAYHELPRSASFPTEEDMACEAQLSALGTWEPLEFRINGWHKDEKNLTDLWRPFQPKPGVSNDRESILIYGAAGALPTDPCGLAQMAAKTGVKPDEDSMIYPTSAKDNFDCLSEVFDFFDLGRTFAVRLNRGGHYPPHRDHMLLTRPTFRLIAFLGDSTGSLKWEVENNRVHVEPNHLYYVDTRKTHSLWSSSDHSTMVVFNVMKNWENTMKILTKLKYQG